MTFTGYHWETIWYVVEWSIRIGALGVVPLRRTASAARAWLLLIFFLPVAGLLLFLAIGSPRFPAWRTERFNRLLPYFGETAERQKRYAPLLTDETAPIASLAQRLGYMPATGGNNIELIDDYDAVIDRLVEDIDAAQRSVHILAYIFADDAVGQRVAAALGRAVARRLEVRVMFDPVGSRSWRKGTTRMLRAQGVDMREALPFRLIRGRTRRDMRNHRKLFVIDGAIGYAGSQNLVAKDFRPGVVNRELVVRVTGPVVSSLDALVRGDWNLETGTLPAHPPTIPDATGSAQVQLLPSGPAFPLNGFETILEWQLHQATDHVIMVTPYFIPDEDVLSAMNAAVARGVRVDLVVSRVVDQYLVNLSQSSYYSALMEAGVRVNLFPNYLLHAKNLSIDDRLAIVGSSNVDLRSFQLNEEASLLLYDADSIAGVKAIQRDYLEQSEQLDANRWARRPRWRIMAENIARLFNSLL